MSLKAKPFTILVEGNIGAGKSTFLKYFDQFKNVEVVLEPVEMFQNLNGTNLLELAYKETKKWAFPFQTYVHLLMLGSHLKSTDKEIMIMERSLFSAQHIFVELLLQNDQIEQVEYDILQKWHDFHIKNFVNQPNLIIYLRAEPDVVFNRIKKRARVEENNVDFDYIKKIHELHEKWLGRMECHDVPVLILDANQSAFEVQQEYAQSVYASKMI